MAWSQQSPTDYKKQKEDEDRNAFQWSQQNPTDYREKRKEEDPQPLQQTTKFHWSQQNPGDYKKQKEDEDREPLVSAKALVQPKTPEKKSFVRRLYEHPVDTLVSLFDTGKPAQPKKLIPTDTSTVVGSVFAGAPATVARGGIEKPYAPARAAESIQKGVKGSLYSFERIGAGARSMIKKEAELQKQGEQPIKGLKKSISTRLGAFKKGYAQPETAPTGEDILKVDWKEHPGPELPLIGTPRQFAGGMVEFGTNPLTWIGAGLGEKIAAKAISTALPRFVAGPLKGGTILGTMGGVEAYAKDEPVLPAVVQGMAGGAVLGAAGEVIKTPFIKKGAKKPIPEVAPEIKPETKPEPMKPEPKPETYISEENIQKVIGGESPLGKLKEYDFEPPFEKLAEKPFEPPFVKPAEIPAERPAATEKVGATKIVQPEIGEVPNTRMQIRALDQEIKSTSIYLETLKKSVRDSVKNVPKEGSIYSYIRSRGGIKPSLSIAGEYRESIPFSLKNKNGMAIDELASELGMDSSQLLNELSKPKSRAFDAESAIGSNPEIQAIQKTLDALKEEKLQLQKEIGITELPEAKVPPAEGITGEGERPLTFIENSVLGSKMTPARMKRDFRENMPTYIQDAHLQESWNKMSERYEANPMLAKSEFQGKSTIDSMDDAMLGQVLMVNAIKKGSIEEAKQVAMQLAVKGKEAGRAVKGLDWFKKLSAEGMLLDAQKTVRKARDDIAKTNPKLAGEFEAKTKQVADNLNQINEEAIDKLANEVVENADNIVQAGKGAAKKKVKKFQPEEELASRVIATAKSKIGKINPVRDMVNTLFKVAQESPLPGAKRPPRDPLSFVSEAIKDRAKYRDIWNKAKEIVQKKYADNPQALQLLEDYFEKGIRRTFAEKQLNKTVSLRLKEAGVNLREIVKQHYLVGSKVRTDLVDRLVSEAGLSGEEAQILEKYIRNRMKDLTKNAKERVLAQIFKDRGKRKAAKTLTEKIVELSNLGAFDNAKYKDLVAEKLGLPSLTKEDAQFIIDTMNKALSLPEGYARNVQLSRVKNLIANKVPVELGEKVKGVLRVSMLANPKTLVTRNPLGNVLLSGAEFTKKIPSALLDISTSLFTGERRTPLPSPGYVKAYAEGFGKGVWEWAKDIWYSHKYKQFIDTNPTRGQAEIVKHRLFNNRVLDFFDRLTKRGLYLGDRPFYQAAYNSKVYELMKLAKTDKPTPEMLMEASGHAMDKVFQAPTKIAEGVSGIRKGINLISSHVGVGTPEFGPGNLVIPFTETPANIVGKAIDYSPLGALNAIKELANARKGTFNQKAFTDALGRMITGTGLYFLGVKLREMGLVTGKPDKDPDKAALEREEGKLPYSFVVKGVHYTFDWIQPAAVPLAVGIDMYDAYHNEKDATKAVWEALESGGNTLFNMSVLQNVGKLFTGYSPMASIGKTMLGTITQVSPTLVKQVAQLFDPTVRETYDPGTFKQIVNRLIARTPYLSKGLQPKIGSWGKAIEAYQGENSIFNVMLNPGFTAKYDPSPAADMVLDLYDKTGEKVQFPRVIKNSIHYKSQTIKLTPEQLTEYKKYAGEQTALKFNKLAKNKLFRSTKPEKQVERLKKELDDIHEEAREKLMKSGKELYLAVKSGQMNINDLNDEGKNVLRQYTEFKEAK